MPFSQERLVELYLEAQRCDPDWKFDPVNDTFYHGYISATPQIKHNIELIGYEGLNPVEKLYRFLKDSHFLSTKALDPKLQVHIGEKFKRKAQVSLYVIGFAWDAKVYQIQEIDRVLLKRKTEGYFGYAISGAINDCAFHLHLCGRLDHQLRTDSETFAANLTKYSVAHQLQEESLHESSEIDFSAVVTQMTEQLAERGYELREDDQ